VYVLSLLTATLTSDALIRISVSVFPGTFFIQFVCDTLQISTIVRNIILQFLISYLSAKSYDIQPASDIPFTNIHVLLCTVEQ